MASEGEFYWALLLLQSNLGFDIVMAYTLSWRCHDETAWLQYKKGLHGLVGEQCARGTHRPSDACQWSLCLAALYMQSSSALLQLYIYIYICLSLNISLMHTHRKVKRQLSVLDPCIENICLFLKSKDNFKAHLMSISSLHPMQQDSTTVWGCLPFCPMLTLNEIFIKKVSNMKHS